MAITTSNYHDARDWIHSGDVGLVRTGNHLARQGRSEYSHAFLCAWRKDDQNTLAIAESREGRGGQVLTLSSQVRRFPGQIDIYRPTAACPEVVRARAATIAFNWSGRGYAYPNILRIWLAHRPLLRAVAEGFGAEFQLASMKPTPWDEAKICSQLAVWAYRWAKHELGYRLLMPAKQWDLCPHLNDAFCEPGDLVRGGGLERVFEGLVIE